MRIVDEIECKFSFRSQFSRRVTWKWKKVDEREKSFPFDLKRSWLTFFFGRRSHFSRDIRTRQSVKVAPWNYLIDQKSPFSPQSTDSWLVSHFILINWEGFNHQNSHLKSSWADYEVSEHEIVQVGLHHSVGETVASAFKLLLALVYFHREEKLIKLRCNESFPLSRLWRARVVKK